jgi:hypothetical protein
MKKHGLGENMAQKYSKDGKLDQKYDFWMGGERTFARHCIY